MGVFGGQRDLVPRLRIPADEAPHPPLSRHVRCGPFITFETQWYAHRRRIAAQRGQGHDLGGRPSAHPRALRGVLALELERSRHRGDRQIEREVDQDREYERVPMRHVPILAHALPLSASKGLTISGPFLSNLSGDADGDQRFARRCEPIRPHEGLERLLDLRPGGGPVSLAQLVHELHERRLRLLQIPHGVGER